MVKWVEDIFVSALKVVEYKVKELEYADAKRKWDLETGERFNDIINHYPVSEDTLLHICREFSEFHALTTVESIQDYLWVNHERKFPRLPWMINNQADYIKYTNNN